jgi:hypothetical protein
MLRTLSPGGRKVKRNHFGVQWWDASPARRPLNRPTPIVRHRSNLRLECDRAYEAQARVQPVGVVLSTPAMQRPMGALVVAVDDETVCRYESS